MVKAGITNPRVARSRECVALRVKKACHRVFELRLLTACRVLPLHHK